MGRRSRTALSLLLSSVLATVGTLAPGLAGPAAAADHHVVLPSAADLDASGGRVIVLRSARTVAIRGGRTARLPRHESRRLTGDRSAAARRLVASDPTITGIVADLPMATFDWPDGWPTPSFPAALPNDQYLAGGNIPPYTGFADEYQRNLIPAGVPEAWKLTTGDPSTVVAVLDTGAWWQEHPDLMGVHFLGTYNALDGSTAIPDGYGHGTGRPRGPVLQRRTCPTVLFNGLP